MKLVGPAAGFPSPLSINTLKIIARRLSAREIYIHITAASRAEFYIARARACDIKYIPEGACRPRAIYLVLHAGLEEPECNTKFSPGGEDDMVYIYSRELFEITVFLG